MELDTPTFETAVSLSSEEIEALYSLCTQAGSAILDVYADESLWNAESKSDDTPVTAADVKSSQILVAGLPEVVNCPVVSEEALPSYEDRKDWPTYWLIDPMDGTREFIHKTGEFVINVALMHNQKPIFGFIYQPTTKLAWWGGLGYGAFRGDLERSERLPLENTNVDSWRVLGSRRSKWKGPWRAKLESTQKPVETESLGSALKFTRLAERTADLYPRLGPTSEWDTAAPEAILAATGGAITQWDKSPIVYGKANTLNPHFVAVADLSLLDLVAEKN